MDSPELQTLPITKQSLLGDFKKMYGLYRTGGCHRSVPTQQFFKRCTVTNAGDWGLRPSFAFPGGSDRFNADF
ncbi:hypothetical protein C7A07_04525 [Pseudomonas fragi]|nr:hypothetical protein [Pseudomonas fragi]PRW99482.1 hypothetical protein C7A07_04525 [Pseudomonas fragi]